MLCLSFFVLRVESGTQGLTQLSVLCHWALPPPSLRNCHTVCTAAVPVRIPTSNMQGFQFLTSSPNSYLLCLKLLLTANLVGLKWFLIVSVCIFLIINDTEHLSMCLLPICIFLLEKCLFSFVILKPRCSSFRCWIVKVLCILNRSLLWDVWFANIFSICG